MDVETERRMMAKFHRKKESSIKLMGTHWYIKDGKGGVNPTALAKPEAVYIKKFWEAEIKKRDKKISSLAAIAQNSATKTAKVTPTKTPKKGMKKVKFVPLSSIKTRSKSKSPTNGEVTNLNVEEWPMPKEASPESKRKSSPPTKMKNNIQDATPTKENPITIDKRAVMTPEQNTAETIEPTNTGVDRRKPILEQIKPVTPFQTFKKDRTQTYKK